MTDQKAELSGLRAIITGASRGIGRALALALADSGVDLALGYHTNQPAADHTAELLTAAGAKFTIIKTDVTDEKSAADFINQSRESLGGIDILIATVGDFATGRLADADAGLFEHQFRSNLLSIHNAVRPALPALRESGRGRVIAFGIAGGESMLSRSGTGVHATMKTAVIAYIKSLARQEAKYGITANTISPGFIDTGQPEAESQIEKIKEKLPMGRPGSLDEACALALFLISAGAGYISGDDIEIAGAWRP